MTSVLQDWVMELPLRAQGTLLTGIRGCDTVPKNPYIDDPGYHNKTEHHGTGDERTARGLTAFLRFCVLNPADPRETDHPGSWFQSSPPASWKPSQLGHHPQHWYAHLMHCYEVVGYCHPDADLRSRAHDVYWRLVLNLHLKPESYEEMMERLTEDRIAAGTVVS